MSDNENKINENSVENFDDSNMSNFEIHSTPSASKDKTELNMSDQSNVTEDSGVQITPTSTKCNRSDNDIMSSILSQLERMSSDMNKRFDTNDAKFDVLTKSLCSIESKLSEMCSEAKREANESRECVCTEKNKTKENSIGKLTL